jgi:hypothetical protein
MIGLLAGLEWETGFDGNGVPFREADVSRRFQVYNDDDATTASLRLYPRSATLRITRGLGYMIRDEMADYVLGDRDWFFGEETEATAEKLFKWDRRELQADPKPHFDQVHQWLCEVDPSYKSMYERFGVQV